MPLNKDDIYAKIAAPDMLDYGVYLNVDQLLQCQKPTDALCNGDELQFQIVHQVEELWMKLMAYTLVDIDAAMQAREDMKALTLFGRVHVIQRLMITQMDLLETMSPRDYQEVRLQLGNGSGQESPGFQLLLTLPPELWKTYQQHYLVGRSVREVYDTGFTHDAAYKLGEAMVEYDELFQKFRAMHIYLIHRTIGMGAASLKGRPVELLNAGTRHRFFPELWDVRWQMTDAWGGTYGKHRPSISDDAADAGTDAAPDAALAGQHSGHGSPTGMPLQAEVPDKGAK